ncbi:hypothetical protein FOVSG1_008503 [Fusarium oxysporum f. sp. vasinfectum]
MAANDDGPIVAPDEDVQDDRDSSIGDDATSSTASLSSSILDFRHENGRTYHAYKDGKYHLPNDERENDRLDLQHNLFLLTFDNKLGLSPPNLPDSKVKRVLDLGTGTGIWAIDFGDDHPEAEVTGVDLSPIQPSFVPPNVRFLIDDIHEQWDFSEPFDYIHSRMMNFSIPNWPEYLNKIYQNLAPGGYVEIQEIDVMMKSDDGTLGDDSAILKWSNLLNEASVKLQQAYKKIDEFKDMMAETGFTEIVDMRFKWPTNHWPKDKKYKELGHHLREPMVGLLKRYMGIGQSAPFMEESLEDKGVSHHVISNRVGKHQGGLDKPYFFKRALDASHSLASAIQSWLFFGLASEALGRNIRYEEFAGADLDGPHPSIDLRIPEWYRRELKARWDELDDSLTAAEFEAMRTQLKKIYESAQIVVIYIDLLANSLDDNKLTEILLSIHMLLYLVAYVLDSNTLKVTQTTTSSASTKLLKRRMVKNGWCEKRLNFLDASLMFYPAFYFLSSLKPPRINAEDHSSCSSDRCLVTSKLSKPLHRTDGCLCEDVVVPVDRVYTIVASGGIPLVRITRSPLGKNELEVVPYTPSKR